MKRNIVLVVMSPSTEPSMRLRPLPAPSMTVSMKMPQKIPSAVMMLRFLLRAMVWPISLQRSVSKSLMAVYLLWRSASMVFSRAARRAGT